MIPICKLPLCVIKQVWYVDSPNSLFRHCPSIDGVLVLSNSDDEFVHKFFLTYHLSFLEVQPPTPSKVSMDVDKTPCT